MAAVVTAPAQRERTEARSEDDRPLPVLPALEPLFAGGGLRRGSAVAVRNSASLLFALLAGPSQRGAWCGVVGMPGLGLLAAAEAGITLERLALVPDPGPDWAAVAAALLDAMEIVVVAPRGAVPDGDARRLAARARQRGAVLVPFGPVPWPGAELRLSLGDGVWEGLGDGSGRLRARRVVVRGEGRGSAARARELPLWLPGPDGAVGPAEPREPAAPVRAVSLPAAAGPRLQAVPDLPVVETPPPAGRWAAVGRAARPPLRAVDTPGSRPAGNPVPAGRPPTAGGGPPVPPPAPHPAEVLARPAIPAEVLARMRPASSLPRPPRPGRAPAPHRLPIPDPAVMPARVAQG